MPSNSSVVVQWLDIQLHTATEEIDQLRMPSMILKVAGWKRCSAVNRFSCRALVDLQPCLAQHNLVGRRVERLAEDAFELECRASVEGLFPQPDSLLWLFVDFAWLVNL